jgi:hypothetical protein
MLGISQDDPKLAPSKMVTTKSERMLTMTVIAAAESPSIVFPSTRYLYCSEHLMNIGRWVSAVTLQEITIQPLGEKPANSCFADSSHAHDHPYQRIVTHLKFPGRMKYFGQRNWEPHFQSPADDLNDFTMRRNGAMNHCRSILPLPPNHDRRLGKILRGQSNAHSSSPLVLEKIWEPPYVARRYNDYQKGIGVYQEVNYGYADLGKR